MPCPAKRIDEIKLRCGFTARHDACYTYTKFNKCYGKSVPCCPTPGADP